MSSEVSSEDLKKRVRLTIKLGELFHLYKTMEILLGAGSECEEDLVVAKTLAKALHKAGYSTPMSVVRVGMDGA